VPARCVDCGSTAWTDAGLCVECRSFPTLGYEVARLIQESCAIPDGLLMGESFLLTDEQLMTALHHYRVHPLTGRFVHFRGTQLVRPQKWGKGPFASAIICAEAHPDGPVVFDGWNEKGEPAGRPWPTPHIQVTAVSEDQTDNVFRALLPMIQLGALAADIPDTGLTRINLPGGGLIEPVTAAARSRLGQRVTFVVQDQTESWLSSNGGHNLSDNQRRGLGGMGGRFLSTPNAWDPVEDSVAQRTAENPAPGVYHDDVEPGEGDIFDATDRRRMLRRVYRDSAVKPRPDAEWAPWIDLERIDGEIVALLKHDAAQAERWFLNRKLAMAGAAFTPGAWDAKAEPRTVPDGAQVAIGIDGALRDDALAAVAVELKTGYVWPLCVIERPDGLTGLALEEYSHDQSVMEGALRDAFSRFTVWRCYCDPQWIDPLLTRLQNEFGDKVVVAWETYRPRPIAWAVRNFEEAVNDTAGKLRHQGDPDLTRHVKNARRRMLTVVDDRERPMHTLAKPAHQSPLKIDLAMAAVLAWEARSDALAKGAVWLGDVAPTGPEPPERPGGWRPGTAPAMPALVGADSGPMGGLS
jgi:hypothetical protein